MIGIGIPISQARTPFMILPSASPAENADAPGRFPNLPERGGFASGRAMV